MVEIKCPPRRKFTKTVPSHYWMQVQGQLEVCGLDECDFFQVKIDELVDVAIVGETDSTRTRPNI